jgi:hypothetical protein
VALGKANIETEDQLRIATITRLAVESRALQDERPIESVLRAAEAVELSQQYHASVLPVAHEALLNATQVQQLGRTLSGHKSKVSTVAMSSKWLITLGEDKAHLWDLTSRQPWLSSRALGNDDEKITSMALSHDVGRLVTGGSKLQLWDLRTRNPELAPLDLLAGETPIIQVSLSPDGRWLATRSEDAQDSCREVIVSDGFIFAMSIDANSRWLATEGPGQTIYSPSQMTLHFC